MIHIKPDSECPVTLLSFSRQQADTSCAVRVLNTRLEVCVRAWQSRVPDVTVLENVPGPCVSQTVIMHPRTFSCLKSCLHVNDPCWWEWRSVWNSTTKRCITAFWCQAALWELSTIFMLLLLNILPLYNHIFICCVFFSLYDWYFIFLYEYFLFI